MHSVNTDRVNPDSVKTERQDYAAASALRQGRDHQSLMGAAWRALLRHRSGMIGLTVVAILLLMSVLAPVLAPYDPLTMHTQDRLTGPSASYPLGNDEFGRDIFSRLLYGGRVAFLVGGLSVLMATLAGVAIGLIAGYEEGWFDTMTMRFFDALLAFLGPGIYNAVLAVTIVNIPIFARLARANVLAEKHKDYVDAARAIGSGSGRILFVTILPNTLATIIVQMTISFAGAVLLESSLSFLGLGVPLPAPSWGSMLSIGRTFMAIAPWYSIFPGVAIMLLVLGIYLLGDGLRDVLDPRRQTTAK
jgi:peptide/nickel transport system permease protein